MKNTNLSFLFATFFLLQFPHKFRLETNHIISLLSKAVAYKLTGSSFNKEVISGRGPLIAELIEGDEVVYHTSRNKTIKIVTEKFLYIKPGASFRLSAKENETIALKNSKK